MPIRLYARTRTAGSMPMRIYGRKQKSVVV